MTDPFQGIQGIPGRPGAEGRAGTEGRPGTEGRSGSTGDTGTPGREGAPGAQGHDGAPGLRGSQGTPGMTGVTGLPGDVGDEGPEGPPGPEGKRGPSMATRLIAMFIFVVLAFAVLSIRADRTAHEAQRANVISCERANRNTESINKFLDILIGFTEKSTLLSRSERIARVEGYQSAKSTPLNCKS